MKPYSVARVVPDDEGDEVPHTGKRVIQTEPIDVKGQKLLIISLLKTAYNFTSVGKSKEVIGKLVKEKTGLDLTEENYSAIINSLKQTVEFENA
jgi:hypothetical protein